MKPRVLITIFLLTFANGTCKREDFIHQHPLLVAEFGSSVILPCSHSNDFINSVSWYKQTIGKKPLLMAYSTFNSGDVVFEKDFNKSKRYFIKVGTGSFNLSISHLEKYDFATYYCAVSFLSVLKFGEGTILLSKETAAIRSTTVLQQPVSDRLHPGDSVTLQCSVISQICAGEYSVYWFRQSSGYSHSGIVYAHDNSGDGCTERSENGFSTQSCVYNLSQTQLTASDAGIYYCAVATCGNIHFGNGTALTIEDAQLLWSPITLVLAALTIMAMVMIIMLLIVIQKIHIKESLNDPRNHWKQTVNSDALKQEETRVIYTQHIMH